MDKCIAELKNLYAKFYESVACHHVSEITPFFMQKGAKYYDSTIKCLFVGKAVNGWVTNSRDVDELFDMNNEKRIINRSDEIEWVEKLGGSKEHYNSRRSAFWRVVKSVSQQLFPGHTWYEHIAWTNLYKFSPAKMNPDARMKRDQLDICIDILDREIQLLSPHVVIFLTSGWECHFADHIGLKSEEAEHCQWSRHELLFQKKGNIAYIRSKHPQGKSECEHVEALVTVIGNKAI